MEAWMLEANIITKNKLDKIKKDIIEKVKKSKRDAWTDYQNSIQTELEKSENIIQKILSQSNNKNEIKKILENLKFEKRLNPHVKNILLSAEKVLRIIKSENNSHKEELKSFIDKYCLEPVDEKITVVRDNKKSESNIKLGSLIHPYRP